MPVVPLVVVAVLLVGYALVSRRLERGAITAPIVFVTAGLALGAGGAGVLDLPIGAGALRVLAEVTLAVVLFTDAARIELRALWREHDLPLRMLLLGLPLAVLFGIAAGFPLGMIGSVPLYGAAILAAILAPTDAALGQAVLTDERVPVRIRQTLNAESGLNDGLALPFVVVALSLAAAEQRPAFQWLGFVARQVGLGLALGALAGGVGGALLERARRADSVTEPMLRISALGVALLAWAGAELAGGNGFLAAFAAGLALRVTAHTACRSLHAFAEAEGQLLTLLVFLAFGALLLPAALERVRPEHLLYAALSLTVVRPLAIAVSLLGTGLRPATVLFLGWFGPRGIASVLFSLVLLERMEVIGREEIAAVVGLTVLVSVFAHGLTAAPLAGRYAAYIRTHPEHVPEHRPVSELPLRVRRSTT